MAPSRRKSKSVRKSRINRSRTSYGVLESREMLTGVSVFNFNSVTGTLQIRAAETNVDGSTFANDMSFSVDGLNRELVIAEANQPEQRFSLTDLNLISYRGTFANDRFTNNTDIPSRVVGFAGDDHITSGDGDDRVIAANGNDTVYPGLGDDYVAGGQGEDMIIETAEAGGNDRLYGGPDADVIESGAGNDIAAGGEGGDTIRLGDGDDFAFGGDGDDEVHAGDGADFVYGNDGDDTAYGELGNDRILGQNGNDTIDGGEGDDSMIGGDGNDTIDGGEGDDRLAGNEGTDTLRGGIGADRIVSATPNSQGNPFGFDLVDAGEDEDVDSILGHPFDSYVNVTEVDSYVNAETIRLFQQTRYLRENIQKTGWNETESGLQFRIVEQGSGPAPASTDIVRVNYSGTFIDGVQFDANDGIAFALNRVISGWTEGLQLLNEGGRIQLAIPANLAYGPNGTQGIPGGSTLLFDVDLLEVF